MNRVFILILISPAIFGCTNRSKGEAPWIKLNDGYQIPSFGLGTWLGLSESNALESKTPDESEVLRAVEWALDSGYRHIDTASFYNSEEEVGQAIQNKISQGVVKREDLFVVAKLWNDRHRRSEVVPAAKESLRRLNLDYVDLYLIHSPFAMFPNISLIDIDYLETWDGMVEVRELGLARSIGVSNFNKTMIDRLVAHSGVKPAVLQVEINLNLQQSELLEYCRRKEIVVTGYTPFGSLFYSKLLPDSPPPRVDDRQLVAIAGKYNKTVTQVALRYIWELRVVPIPKSVHKKRIEENIKIFDFQLSEQDKELLKSFDKNYRTLPLSFWKDYPYYPFYP